ncbi:asparagine synthase-related protein [bacterium]|nr:asparagine synthase-related protein [bacterium]
MCGIAAFFSRREKLDTNNIAAKMLSSIAHRGPDESGVLSFKFMGGLSIAANRLSIIGRSSTNITPFTKTGSNIVLSYNGEIYNHLQIKKELEKKGVSFDSKTDTEVFFEAWRYWGKKALTKFNGMFAALIFDELEGKLYLVRDVAGQKPLYFYHSETCFAVASEAKAFQELPLQLSLTNSNESVFYECFQHNHKKTLYENVFQVLPATIVTVDLKNNDVKEQYYWEPSFETVNMSFDDSTDCLKELLTASVQRHCQSEVKYGIYLSDGLDSNVLNILGNFDNAYTYESSDVSEREVYEKLPEITKSLDFPIASLSSYPLYKLASLAAEDNCTVVLSGEGADELFGGYVRYLLPMSIDRLWQDKSNYKPLFSKAVPDPSTIFSKITCRNTNFEYVKELFDEIRQKTPDLLSAMQFFDFKYIMPSLLNMGDRMSSRFSLENRCPYLDKSIIDFAFGLPLEFKYHGGNQKRVLHKLGADLGFNMKTQKSGLTIDFNNYLHRDDWDRSSYFSILNYIWISMHNNYRAEFNK